ncbi:MAG: FliI/YscN family ATPase [Planctomycetota bacterium]
MIGISGSELLLETGVLTSVRGTLNASLNASVGELVEIHPGEGEPVLGEVIGFDGEFVQLMSFNETVNLRLNDRVVALRRGMKMPAGNGLLGRILNATGQPIDDTGPLQYSENVEIRFQTPDPLTRQPIREPFVTGIRAIDGMLTLGRGQRAGLFAGSGVGKSTLLGEIARHASSEVNVVALIGERGREVRPFVEEALGPRGLERSVVIVSTSDQTPLARIRASESAVKIADWFRSQGRQVLLMLDSLTRLAIARREIGLLLGEPPTSRGYTPGVFQHMAVLLEQLGTSSRGSITGLLTVLVDGDDMNDPVADAARSILDGHIVLDRKLAHRGHYPAIDVLASASRLFHEITGPEHQEAASTARQILANYREVEDLIQIGAFKPGNVPETDASVSLLPEVNRFLKQGLGKPSSLEQTTTGLHELNAGFQTLVGRTPA